MSWNEINVRFALSSLNENFPDPANALTYLFQFLLPVASQSFDENPDLLCFFLIEVFASLNRVSNTSPGSLLKFLLDPQNQILKKWFAIADKVSSGNARIPILLPSFSLSISSHKCRNFGACFYDNLSMCLTEDFALGEYDIYVTALKDGVCNHVCNKCYLHYIVQSFERCSWNSMEQYKLDNQQFYLQIPLTGVESCCNCITMKNLGISKTVDKITPFHYLYYPRTLTIRKCHILCGDCYQILPLTYIAEHYCAVCSNTVF